MNSSVTCFAAHNRCWLVARTGRSISARRLITGIGNSHLEIRAFHARILRARARARANLISDDQSDQSVLMEA